MQHVLMAIHFCRSFKRDARVTELGLRLRAGGADARTDGFGPRAGGHLIHGETTRGRETR